MRATGLIKRSAISLRELESFRWSLHNRPAVIKSSIAAAKWNPELRVLQALTYSLWLGQPNVQFFSDKGCPQDMGLFCCKTGTDWRQVGHPHFCHSLVSSTLHQSVIYWACTVCQAYTNTLPIVAYIMLRTRRDRCEYPFTGIQGWNYLTTEVTHPVKHLSQDSDPGPQTLRSSPIDHTVSFSEWLDAQHRGSGMRFPSRE